MKDNRATSNNSTQPSAFSHNPMPKIQKASNVHSVTTATGSATNGKGGVVGQKVDYTA